VGSRIGFPDAVGRQPGVHLRSQNPLVTFGRWLGQKVRAAFTLDDLDRLMDSVVGGRPTLSGANVSEQSALCLPAVFACVDLISRVSSILPGHVYKRTTDGRELAPVHYLYPLVHDLANPWLPAMEWRRITLSHLLTWGNAYSWIEWNNAGVPKYLWIIPPDKIKVQRATITDPIRYFIRDTAGIWQEFPESDILHIRGLGFDGTMGYSPVGLMRETMGLSDATQQTAAAMHGNGYSSRLVLEYAGTLEPEQIATLRASLNESNGGLRNKFKAIVLQAGMKATPISINPHDAEFLAQWKHLDAKIYQIYGVPPHLVGDTEKATSFGTGIETQNNAFVTFTMLPWMDLIETWLAIKLLPEAARRQYFVEFDMKGLMRGDSAARAAWYGMMIDKGVYTPNRVLRSENEQTYAGGDVYRRDLNAVYVDANGKPVLTLAPPPDPSSN
jgi:HK97 family phage portal protein